MAVPEFNEIKAPALQFFSDGQEHKMSEVFDSLAKHFNLTPEQVDEMLPSGTQRRWHNRVQWACYDLFRAELLERVKRGTYKITQAGKEVAAKKPSLIDRNFLMQFPAFVKFLATEKKSTGEPLGVPTASDSNIQTQTPEELIGGAYQMLHNTLKTDILDRVKKMDHFKFEHLVVDLLVAMGYGGSREEAARVTKKSGDEGIDGVINEDRLGLDVIYLQAKKWENTIGRKQIQEFVGALAGQQAHKGVFITTSDFADTAIDYAKKVAQKVILIDGERLAELMIEHHIGVARKQAYIVKAVDNDYFEDEE